MNQPPSQPVNGPAAGSSAFQAMVLAGGRSSRLGGTPKALFRCDEHSPTLVEATVQALLDSGVAPGAVVVVGPPDLPTMPVSVTREDPPFAGPAAGIVAGLASLGSTGQHRSWTLVLACDMPRVRGVVVALVDAAAAAGPEIRGVVVTDGGHAQPLAGVYRTPELSLAIRGQLSVNRSVRSLVGSLWDRHLELPGTTEDVDTWEDVSRFGLIAPRAPVPNPPGGRETVQPQRSPETMADPARMPPDGPHGASTIEQATWDQARTVAHAAATALPPQWLPLQDTVGETLAESVTAAFALPHYSSAAMDGWAVSGTGPWELVTPQPEADDPRLAWAQTGPDHTPGVERLYGGQATPILTGGLVPEGASAVVRSEWGLETDGRLLLSPEAREGSPTPGEHIRPAGEEAQVGDVLLSAGTRLNPAHVALAAVAGQDMLPVRRRPRVTLLLTGDEVDDSGVPEPGRVRDAFGPQLPQFIHMLGGHVDAVHRLGDDLAALTERLTVPETGAESVVDSRAQLIITTGGTGGSSADHLRSALRNAGAHLLVDQLALRPGHPALLARMPDDGPFVLGLPGNPLAAMTALMLLGAPLLAGFGGAALPPTRKVSLTHAVEPFKTVRLVPGVDRSAPGGLSGATDTGSPEPKAPWAGVPGAPRLPVPSATTVGHSGANMLRGFSQANVLLVIPAEGVAEGGTAVAVPLPWL